MEPDQVDRLRNTEELNVEQSGKQEGQRPSGPSCHPWTDYEIRIFLEEWEVVERRVGNPGRKISETIQALCLQLNERRGLKKSWESCVDLLLTLQNLHRSLCSGRPGAVPLFSPYSEALFRILGRPPGPYCRDGSGICLPACQELSTFRESAFRLWYHRSFYTASGEPTVYEVLEEFCFPEGIPLKHSHPLSFPHLPPACDPGDPHVRQQPWSTLISTQILSEDKWSFLFLL